MQRFIDIRPYVVSETHRAKNVTAISEKLWELLSQKGDHQSIDNISNAFNAECAKRDYAKGDRFNHVDILFDTEISGKNVKMKGWHGGIKSVTQYPALLFMLASELFYEKETVCVL